jgi:putative membrane protein
VTAAALGDVLARVNACLNLSSLLLLIAGFVAIKQKRIERHRAMMQLAFAASAIFLVSYLARFALTGVHHLAAGGWVKIGYLSLLFSHMILAAAAVPLVLRTLWLARRGRIPEHRRWARLTFPVWLYVSVTGVLVFAILYHVVGTRD